MKAIEFNAKTDGEGTLIIEHPLKLPNVNVRVLILIDDEDEERGEMQWVKALSKNPSFDFLNDPDENIHTLKDGKPLDD